MIIYAVTNGYLDQIPVSEVRAWERDFLEMMASQRVQIQDKIRNEKAMSKETEAELKAAIEQFNQSRSPANTAA